MLENRSIRRFDYMTNEPTRKGQGDHRSAWFSESGGKGVSISALCPPFSPFKSFGSEKYQPLIPANHFWQGLKGDSRNRAVHRLLTVNLQA